jgi:acetyl-CoA decarbonylase/synthase complex subunit epsilon
VLGPFFEPYSNSNNPAITCILELIQAAKIPVCATATVKGKLSELGLEPDSVYDAVEMVDALKDPNWGGVRGEGNHDLVIFFGIRSDLLEQCLSALKHFAFDHLRTMTLDRYYFPHANYSLSNFMREELWQDFLEGVIRSLKKGR